MQFQVIILSSHLALKTLCLHVVRYGVSHTILYVIYIYIYIYINHLFIQSADFLGFLCNCIAMLVDFSIFGVIYGFANCFYWLC